MDQEKPTVLYVEDNAVNMRLMETIFNNFSDYRLLTAKSVEETLNVLETNHHKPDLFLIDIDLPDGDGVALLNAIRTNPKLKDVPACAVSANATQADVNRGLAGGFEKYITKPININEFCSYVGQKLG